MYDTDQVKKLNDGPCDNLFDNSYFQPEASIHTYGALPTAVLSNTYSGVH